MNVNFLDLKSQYELIKDEVQTELNNVLQNTAFISGPFVEKFEKNFSRFCNTKFAIAVNSGTSALHLSLLANKIGPNDEVITVPNTFIATTWAISYCGAQPVFVDIDPEKFLMDPSLIENAITSKTKAILPVHLYGQPANMSEINEIAKKYNLVVIEDAAQAHASYYKNKIIGDSNNTTCFSFYPGKNLGAYGEGGAVVTNDEKIYKYIKQLRDHGQSEKYVHEFIGYNNRMDGFQGAILNIKLKYLKEWTKNRNIIAQRYSEKLNKVNQVQTPNIDKNVISAFHLYVIHVSNRDELASYLNENNIYTGLHYPIPIHLQAAYKNLNHKIGDFPISEKNAKNCLSLPIYSELPLEHVDYVCEKIINFYK